MKYIILPVVILFLVSCSVDKDDLNDSQISDLNAIVETEGCEVDTYNFGDVGKIEVTNDTETLYVTVASTAENFDLSNSKLHIANSESGFPTVGRGNLPPGKMEHNKDFESNEKAYTFEFPLADFEGCVYIASQSIFSNGEELVTNWAGDINVKYGNWSYFEYCIQECIPTCEDPIYTGPSVLTGSINYTKANALPSNDKVQEIFANLVIETGEYLKDYNDLKIFSRYSPSISAIVAKFSTELNEPFETYDLETTYSYGTGECAGTIDLIITVIDDRNME